MISYLLSLSTRAGIYIANRECPVRTLMRSKWKRIKKPKHYTKPRHFAAKTVEAKWGSDSESVVAETFIALLMAGLSAYGFK